MLKTLQITSLVVLILAVCGVVLVVFLGLCKDSEIVAYLDGPGVVSKFKGQGGDGEKKELESPLVAQAIAFALRINPPAPPVVKKDPVEPIEPIKKPTTQRTKPAITPPILTPPKTSTKFSLLATVMCQANPKRSMVLLRQAGGKDEWFWQGETVGQLQVEEVRDGSAVFSQNGRNKQELFVPEKPKTKSLLKADAGISRPTPAGGGGSISVMLDPETGEPISEEEAAAVTVSGTERPAPVNRPTTAERRADVSQRHQEVSSRIRRIRTVPKPPSPAEKKESLESSISSIQEIMNREDAGIDQEERQKENEAWMKLLESLQTQKESIGETADKKEAASSSSEGETQPEEDTPAPEEREE